MTEGHVLSLCDRTGTMVKPWTDAGYRATIVDLQHPAGSHTDGLLTRVGADLSTWMPPLDTYTAVFAFPPCTHLAVSGARWFRDKGLKALIEGLTLVQRCLEIAEWTGAPWMIENPMSTLSTYWREPDWTFNPADYGGYVEGRDAYTKLTCIWAGAGFVMPDKRPVPPVEGSKMHRLSPGPERANLRSATPEGFARAVYLANAKEVRPDLLGVIA
jgi:hypothetical protein